MTMYDNLQTFMRHTWDGITNAEIQTIINQADHEDLVDAEAFLVAQPEYQTGIPFPGADAVWDLIYASEAGAQALQRIVDLYE